jgi:hypothetical protein
VPVSIAQTETVPSLQVGEAETPGLRLQFKLFPTFHQ